MAIVNNPQDYDSKVPTNIRLVEVLKILAIGEASRREITLARVVNEALADRYNIIMEEDE